MNVVIRGGHAIVQLDWIEVYHAASAGIRRRIEAVKHGRSDYYCDGKPWEREILGACGEMAVAALKNRYWHAIASRVEGIPGDAGNYEVRATKRSNGHLILRPQEEPDKRFYLVTGDLAVNPPVLTIRGSKLASEAKVERYWRTDIPKPAFMVPQADLDPVDLSK